GRLARLRQGPLVRFRAIIARPEDGDFLRHIATSRDGEWGVVTRQVRVYSAGSSLTTGQRPGNTVGIESGRCMTSSYWEGARRAWGHGGGGGGGKGRPRGAGARGGGVPFSGVCPEKGPHGARPPGPAVPHGRSLRHPRRPGRGRFPRRHGQGPCRRGRLRRQ